MTKKLAFLFLAVTLVFSACRKDTDTTTMMTTGGGTDNPPTPTSEIVIGNLIGNITDELNNPVEGAAVQLKSNTTFTDENGNFSFLNTQMEDDGALLTINKAGFFEAFDRVRATANQTSYTRIQLLDRSIIGSFPAGAAESVAFDGASVAFQSNGFVDDTGADYTGTVNVAAKWIDPTSDVLDLQMPGDLRAIDAENEFAALQSYGMIAVDLIADNGSDLQLKEGLTAEISLPIPSEISNNAPATIPLWSFDEEQGLWVEDGTATKVGNLYVGNVSHFSFWNCDAPFPLIEMEGQIVDENGDPIDQAYVCIDFANDSGYGAGGWSNEDGIFGGKIPQDEPLILSVKNQCWDPIFTTEIGPFSDDVDLGQISVTNYSSFVVGVSGTLVNCDGDPVANGYAQVNTDSSSYYQFPIQLDENGNWSTEFLVCENDLNVAVSGYDLDGVDGPLTSEVFTFTAAAGTDIDAGVIEVCIELDEFLNATADGVETFFIPSISNDGDFHRITGNGGGSPNTQDSLSSFTLEYIGTGVGTYSGEDVQFLSVFNFDPTTGNEEGYFCEGQCDIIVEITLYEDLGGFVQGTYSGTAFDFMQNTIPVNGSFRIRRD